MGRLFEQISGEGDAAKKGKVVKSCNIHQQIVTLTIGNSDHSPLLHESHGHSLQQGDAAKKGKVVKKIVTGMKGSGKTVHLLQAMAMGCHVGGPFQAGGISTSPAWA
jgi:hypothetical protein